MKTSVQVTDAAASVSSANQTGIYPVPTSHLKNSHQGQLAQAFAAALLGAAVLFAVGFLPMDLAHNAAHDTRHALAFPCH